MVCDSVCGLDYVVIAGMALTAFKLPSHGGDLQWALEHFGGTASEWLDLSTGISPWSWPVPEMPQRVWHRLPPVNDSGLRHAAAAFYGCPVDCVLPVPGSQFAIAHYPRLVPPGRVAVPDPGYSEHALAWQAAGHQLVYYATQAELANLIEHKQVQHAVVINPNNPTGEEIEAGCLRNWCCQLSQHDGVLVVDEAFRDCRPEQSLATSMPSDNLIVLRSLGKFFGLAGVRLGFLLANPAWIHRFSAVCQPWQVSGPAHFIGTRALADDQWQATQRTRLGRASANLQSALQSILWNGLRRFPVDSASCDPLADNAAQSVKGLTLTRSDLFVTLMGPSQGLYSIFLHAADQRILLRFGHTGDGKAWLRIGLPGSSANVLKTRLESVFSAIN